MITIKEGRRGIVQQEKKKVITKQEEGRGVSSATERKKTREKHPDKESSFLEK